MSNFDEGFGVVRQLPWSVHLVSYNDSELLKTALLLLSTVTHVTWISILADGQGDAEVDTTRWVTKFCEVLEALDLASPSGEQLLLRRNSSGENVSYAVSFKGTELSVIVDVAARVPIDDSSCLHPVTWK